MENDPMSNIDKKKLKYTKNHLPLLQNVNKNKNKTTGKIINVHKYISLVFSLNLSGLLSCEKHLKFYYDLKKSLWYCHSIIKKKLT